MDKIEYRVRPVTRYVVTRFHRSGSSQGCEWKGEYENAQTAHEVAYAICRMEHQNLGWPLEDDRILYPKWDDLMRADPVRADSDDGPAPPVSAKAMEPR